MKWLIISREDQLLDDDQKTNIFKEFITKKRSLSIVTICVTDNKK